MIAPQSKKETDKGGSNTQVRTYWSERMPAARPRSRRAAKRNGMERIRGAN